MREGRDSVAGARYGLVMDALETSDLELALRLTPEEKLLQALEMMQTGFRWKRATLRAAHPAASEAEIDIALEQWICSDD